MAAIAVLIVVLWQLFSGDTETAQPGDSQTAPENPVTEIRTETEAEKPAGPLYAEANLNSDVKKKITDKLMEISPVFRDSGADADYARNVVDNNSFAFDYDDRRYIVAADYSGGAHCCFGWHVFTLDSRNNLNEIKPDAPIATGGDFGPVNAKTNLAEKNGRLYLVLGDDRFAYYCGSFAGSPMLDRYFLIEDGKLTLGNGDFKNEFLAKAENYDKELAEKYLNLSSKMDRDGAEARCFLLVNRTANYHLAGSPKAWDDFDSLFNKLVPVNPYKVKEGRFITAPEMKKDIRETMDEHG